MTEWSVIRIKSKLVRRLAEYKIQTGIPAATVAQIAIERYLDEQEKPQDPIWLRELKENIELVDELRKILKENP